jgi:hypothetical protein
MRVLKSISSTIRDKAMIRYMTLQAFFSEVNKIPPREIIDDMEIINNKV